MGSGTQVELPRNSGISRFKEFERAEKFSGCQPTDTL